MQPTLHEDTSRTMIFIHFFITHRLYHSLGKNIFIFKLYTFHEYTHSYYYVCGDIMSHVFRYI